MDYDYANLSNINQWALFNDGSFVYDGYYGGSWLTSNPLAIKGYDINNIINAIKYSEDNGASICCLSFSFTKFCKELYDTIKNSKMLFVVAAGNESLDLNENNNITLYPAKFDLDNIIVVADMRSDGKLSEISNWGNISVDIAAPGTDIISTAPNNQFIYSSGTSFSVPYVACEAALIYQHSSEQLSALQLKEKIISTATYNSYFENKILSSEYINIYSALSSCE